MPGLFSQLTVSPSASQSRDGEREQAIHRGSGTFGTNSLSESTIAHRYERHVGRFCAHKSILTEYYSVAISRPDTSRLNEDPKKPRPVPKPAPNARTPSHPPVVAPPPHLPHLVQGKLRLPLQKVCHSENVQRLMERRRISWGVQYELARGILAERWKWEDITDGVLERLEGPNAVAAPKVRSVMANAIGEGNAVYHVDLGTTAELW